MQDIKVIKVIPGKQPELGEIANTLSAMQDFVEGYIEEATLERGVTIVCNEEGRIRGMANNRALPGIGMIKGPFLICSTKGDEFASISDKMAAKYMKLLKNSNAPRM